jgi:integrase
MAKSTARHASPGLGSVFPRKDRPGWRGRLTWTDTDGIRHVRVVSGSTSQEARAELDKLRDQARRGTLTATTGTLGKYLDAWIERDRARVRHSTWRTREMHVRCYLKPTMGTIPMTKLTAADIERILAGFLVTGRPDRPAIRGRGRQNAAGISAQTVRHIRGTLRAALADAVRDQLVDRNAAADARPVKVEHRPIVYLSTIDLRRFLDATAEDDLGPLYTLAATTGLRLGELLGLAWGDIDFSANTLTVRHSISRDDANRFRLAQPKSARSRRTIPLPARARLALETQRTRQRFARAAVGEAVWQDRLGLCFTDSVGNPMRPGGVSWRFHKARDAAGIPRVRFHDLRHSAATALLSAGVPMAVISEWLGHAGIAITASTYAAVVPELLTEAASAMDRALMGTAG